MGVGRGSGEINGAVGIDLKTKEQLRFACMYDPTTKLFLMWKWINHIFFIGQKIEIINNDHSD